MEANPVNTTRGTSRFWCITIHKILDTDIETIVNDPEFGTEYIKTFLEQAVGQEERISYFVGQLERGGATGRLHLQCYLELRGQGGIRGSQIRSMLGLGGNEAYVYPVLCTFTESLNSIANAYANRMDILFVINVSKP